MERAPYAGWGIESNQLAYGTTQELAAHAVECALLAAASEISTPTQPREEGAMAIVTDLAMPGLTGVELIQQLRARVGLVPAVLIPDHQKDPATSPIEPPFEFVRKPLNLERLEDLPYHCSHRKVPGQMNEGSR